MRQPQIDVSKVPFTFNKSEEKVLVELATEMVWRLEHRPDGYRVATIQAVRHMNHVIAVALSRSHKS